MYLVFLKLEEMAVLSAGSQLQLLCEALLALQVSLRLVVEVEAEAEVERG